MSELASVVSDGSPGSSLLILGIGMPLFKLVSATALDRVRGRLAGGFVESIDIVDFLCLLLVGVCVEVSSPASSPEASRDEGCCSSTVEDFFIPVARFAVRFRFPEPDDEGEDISIVTAQFVTNL